jgi:phage tail-like protein
MNDSTEKKRYIDFLPSVFKKADDDFFERYLIILERILSGTDDVVKIGGEEIKGISSVLDTVSELFYPYSETGGEIPPDFLDWLSTWVGLVLKEDWSTEKKQEVIANIIPIYRLRGTRVGLNELLKIYIGEGAEVYDSYAPFQVGVNSAVGISTALGAPNYFMVEATFPDIAGMEQRKKNIEAIIEREKPVHADFEIRWIGVPALQIEVKSTLEIKDSYGFVWGSS